MSRSSSPRLLFDIEIEKTAKRLRKEARLRKQAETEFSSPSSSSTYPVQQTVQFVESEGSEDTDAETELGTDTESATPLWR